MPAPTPTWDFDRARLARTRFADLPASVPVGADLFGELEARAAAAGMAVGDFVEEAPSTLVAPGSTWTWR